MKKHRVHAIMEDAKRVQESLGANLTPQRCITAVARRVLLDGPYFWNGRRINPVGKSLGAGVWEIRNKEVEG